MTSQVLCQQVDSLDSGHIMHCQELGHTGLDFTNVRLS